MALYELAILGDPSQDQLDELTKMLTQAAENFQLKMGVDIKLSIKPKQFSPDSRSASAVIFFGGKDSSNIDVHSILSSQTITILPVASTLDNFSSEIPNSLKSLNCMFYDTDGAERVFSALLECVELLPRQRRIFLSYKRGDSTPAALQLFAALSARQYNVFLDTHSIGPAVEFQDELWHQLCEVDVLIMLETPNYFSSRWTTAEYGRALSKGIGVLQVQWPDLTPSIITGTSSRVELIDSELDANGELAVSAINRICLQLEQVRTLSHAVRHVSVIQSVMNAVKKINAQIDGIGPNKIIYITLKSGKQMLIQPHIGIPDALTLQSTLESAGSLASAIVYDHLGLKPSWVNHLDWLGRSVQGAQWVKSSETAWQFAGYY
jgi:hypothetical protein